MAGDRQRCGWSSVCGAAAAHHLVRACDRDAPPEYVAVCLPAFDPELARREV